MSADRIAEVVSDIRAGRAIRPDGLPDAIYDPLHGAAQLDQPVIDCTAIFKTALSQKGVNLYEDNPCITPPWEDALFGYVNSYNNTIIIQCHRDDWDGTPIDREQWNTDNDVDWAGIRWIATSSMWIGGMSSGRILPTYGPVHIFRHAIRGDGKPEDINWIDTRPNPTGHVHDPISGLWEAAAVTLTTSLNFLNCKNVDIAEPARPRPERRRIARTGVRVQTIVVRPPGRRRAGTSETRPIDAIETPLTPVRGHFARYGVDGRGRLFGQHTGVFWIQAHARGAGEGKPGPRAYTLKP